jgi:hypothetical protein
MASALGSLAQPLRLLLQADAAIEFEARHRLAAQDLKQREVLRLKLVWLHGQQRECAHHLLCAGRQRCSGVGESGLCARHRDSLGKKSPVLRRVGDQKRFALFQHPLAGRNSTRLFDCLEAIPRFEPNPVEVHPTYIGIIGATEHRGQLHQLVESRVRVTVEDIELRMQIRFLGLK